jgi:hypothetical protein
MEGVIGENIKSREEDLELSGLPHTAKPRARRGTPRGIDHSGISP